MELTQKKILVTGGAGFLGSHLCDRLLSEDHEVVCVDNYFTGSKANIKHLLGNSNFELIRHDVTFPLYIEVDEIYNLACPASPIHYQYDPVQTIKTSVHGAINMLGLAKRIGAKIFQASTSEVYGDPEIHPQDEGYWGRVNPVGIRSCYDEGKRCAETLFFDYHRQHNLNIRVARIFNTYGPRMHPNDGRVVSNFIVQALNNTNITIYGNGSQTRSFCYVDDLIEGFIRFIFYLFGMMQPARKLGGVNVKIQVGIASAERVFKIFDTKAILCLVNLRLLILNISIIFSVNFCFIFLSYYNYFIYKIIIYLFILSFSNFLFCATNGGHLFLSKYIT